MTLEAAADHYAAETNLDLALRFLAAIEESYERLARHPRAGAPVKAFSPRLEGLRFRPVAGFDRYLVFYVTSPECVEVVRVLHGARDLALAFETEPQERLEEQQERER